MSVSKPAIADVRWGVDGSNVDAANVVAPTSGARDAGWTLNQIPTSGVENYLKNRPYRWFQFIDEVFKVAGTAVADLRISGQATFGGSLTVGGQTITFGPATFTADNTTEIFTVTAHALVTGDGPLRVTTTGTLPAGLIAGTDYWVIVLTANTFQLATSLANALDGLFLAITTNGTGTNAIASTVSTVRPATTLLSGLVTQGKTLVHGSVNVDNNVATGGTITAGTGLTVTTGGAAVGGNATVSGTLGVAGLITATAGVTAGANQNVTVSGTGQYKHGTRTLMISHVQGVAEGNAPVINRNGYRTNDAGSATADFPIFLEVGQRILAVRANVLDVSGASWLFTVRSLSSTGVDAVIGTSASSSGAGTNQQLSVTGLTTVVALLTSYHVELSWGASGSQNGTIRSIEVDFDRP